MDKDIISGKFYAAASQKIGYFFVLLLGIYFIRNIVSNIASSANQSIYISSILLVIFWIFLMVLIVIWFFRGPIIQIDAKRVAVVKLVGGLQLVPIEEITDLAIIGRKIILEKRNGKQLVIREIKFLKKEEQSAAIRCFESLAAKKRQETQETKATL